MVEEEELVLVDGVALMEREVPAMMAVPFITPFLAKKLMMASSAALALSLLLSAE